MLEENRKEKSHLDRRESKRYTQDLSIGNTVVYCLPEKLERHCSKSLDTSRVTIQTVLPVTGLIQHILHSDSAETGDWKHVEQIMYTAQCISSPRDRVHGLL